MQEEWCGRGLPRTRRFRETNILAPVSKNQITGVTVMNLRPLQDRVMVKRIEVAETAVGGIIIPDTAKEKPQQAEVVAAGTGKLLKNGQRTTMDVKPGDRILFGKYSGAEVRIDGQEYLILREDEILAILG
jgi:chaperonin GroES